MQDYEKLKFHRHLLIDVRPAIGFNICSLPGSINIPLKEMPGNLERIKELSKGERVICVCKHGNESQRATKMLLDSGIEACDIIGGVVRYSKEINSSFPIY